MRKLDEERWEHFEKLLQGLSSFSKELEKTSGPTFLADGQLSNVDLTLIPWAFRYYVSGRQNNVHFCNGDKRESLTDGFQSWVMQQVLEHYRGPKFTIPQSSGFNAYHRWYDHVMNLDSVRRTLPDKDQYLEHIYKYADGSARSKVANAVRRGVSAHELDDEKDDY